MFLKLWLAVVTGPQIFPRERDSYCPFLCWQYCPVVLTGAWIDCERTPFVSTHITSQATPAVGPEAIHSDEDSCFQHRDKCTEGNIIISGIAQPAREGGGALTLSVSWHPFHYDQNIKAHTLAQRGEKSLLLTDLCINNDNERAPTSPEKQKLSLAIVPYFITKALATSSSRL